MALTDPELDLLLELLEEDPVSDVYLQVGEELLRRCRWDEAYAVLHAGTQASEVPASALAAYARACLEAGQLDDALHSVARVRQRVPELPPSLARVEFLALERSGRHDEARERVRARLAVDPDDVVAQSAHERLEAPPPDVRRRARDPFVTVARAESYAHAGRVDRAVRAYRRILENNQSDRGVAARLAQLLNQPHEPVDDDLSEELADPSLVPPELKAPRPRLRDLRSALPPARVADRQQSTTSAGRGLDKGEGDDIEDLVSTPVSRRRRS